MTTVVYLDVVLAGNIVMNYAILWATAKFARLNPSGWRMLFGAALGSIYAVAVFIPQWQWLLMWGCKFIISVLMVLSVFAPIPWRRFFICLGYFYVASFAMGGAVMGTIYFIHSQNNNAYFFNLMKLVQKHFWVGAASALLITWVLGRWGTAAFRRRVYQRNFKTPVVIEILNQQVRVDALLDTGNSLTDPVTGLPVMVVEYGVIKNLLPGCIKRLYEDAGSIDYLKLQQILKNSPWASRFYIIPYRSLGEKNGILLGVKPDKLAIGHDKQLIVKKEALVAIHNGTIAADSGYRALLHPELMDAA
ncbi:stage II sporulation protein GA (sporulation sigma-E factor processing peptidase) [Desulfohalotomaculum tongense]|uniref:sigma-E processing peptidase SpoIIGA n=1 Tax=Desulforadius tongensis TaxID=1216062 RepID=UPI00195CBF17|nr:sigma-E processing peptidase SpoIIGA [Desulforadius tongensis]MBM7855224.1 stage II sporulation protein GA (sporulation sigma-E factor processing peptidase) [Desulforadius tongensis]